MKKIRVIPVLLLMSSFAFADLMDSYDHDDIPVKKKEEPRKEKKVPKKVENPKESPKKNTKGTTEPLSKKNKEKRAPVHFQGQGLTGLKKEGMVELHKSVIVTQEDFRLEADEAKIFLQGDTSDVREVIAEGHVKITKTDETTGKLVKANGDMAEFDNATQLVTLSGNAKVVKGDDVITGNLIYYNLQTGWIKVEKVKGVVNP